MPSLTLSRRNGESIIIDHDIRITVHSMKDGVAKVTIDAPLDVNIVREELVNEAHTE